MQPKSTSTRLRAVAVTLSVVLFLTSAWAADHETVLYSFGSSDDGGGGSQPDQGRCRESLWHGRRRHLPVRR